MKATIFLLLYFFTYSAAFAGVAVCAYARVRGGPRWLNLYQGWLVSAIGFMLIRNGSYFAKQFMGYAAVESTLAFYALYMVTTALFLGFLSCNSLYLVMPARVRVNVLVTGVLAGIPLLCIPLLFAVGGANPPEGLRLLLVDVIMYYAFAGVDGVLLFLFLRLRSIENRFVRSIINSDLYAGVLYVILSVSQWFTYYDEPYSLDPFCVVNVCLFVMFVASAFVIGREFLVKDRAAAGVPAGLEGAKGEQGLTPPYDDASVFHADSGLTERELRIVALIRRGATNQEIADATGVKLAAVKSAIYRIFTRYGVSSRAALIHALEGRSGEGESSPAETGLAQRDSVLR
jgi:DNA-binding CsgD family transcriptional regulator